MTNEMPLDLTTLRVWLNWDPFRWIVFQLGLKFMDSHLSSFNYWKLMFMARVALQRYNCHDLRKYQLWYCMYATENTVEFKFVSQEINLWWMISSAIPYHTQEHCKSHQSANCQVYILSISLTWPGNGSSSSPHADKLLEQFMGWGKYQNYFQSDG